MPGVFLSYRRVDGDWAGRLHDHLFLRFGDDLVFQDVEDIEPGDRWRDVIANQIAGCEAFLVLIGPTWLELRDAEGQRRIAREDDVLRGEIAHAFEQARIVVPVLAGGAAMPDAKDLPPSIQDVTEWQAAELSDEHWVADVEALIDRLRELLAASREAVDIGSVHRELSELFELFHDFAQGLGNATEALELMQRASGILDRALPLCPQDPVLKATRGRVGANKAVALRRLGYKDGSDRALTESERVFDAMRTEDPKDPAAWTGLGSVAGLGGDYEQAIKHIDEALAIDPDYQPALQQRARVVRLVGSSAAQPDTPPRPEYDPVGEWEMTTPNEGQFRFRTTWNPTAERYESTLTQPSSFQRSVGFRTGEVTSFSYPTDDPDILRHEVKYRRGVGGHTSRVEWVTLEPTSVTRISADEYQGSGFHVVRVDRRHGEE